MAVQNRFTAPIKILPGTNSPLPVFILAGSVGNRMKIYDSKFLYRTSLGPLGLRQLSSIHDKYTMTDIVLLTGPSMGKIYKMDLGVKLIENKTWEETSDVECVRLGLNIIPRETRCLLISGDSFFQTLPKIQAGKSFALTYNDQDEDTIGLNCDSRLRSTGFGFERKWGGVLYLEGKEFNLLKKFCVPKNAKCELWEFLNYAVNQGGNIDCMEHPIRVINSANKIRELKDL